MGPLLQINGRPRAGPATGLRRRHSYNHDKRPSNGNLAVETRACGNNSYYQQTDTESNLDWLWATGGLALDGANSCDGQSGPGRASMLAHSVQAISVVRTLPYGSSTLTVGCLPTAAVEEPRVDLHRKSSDGRRSRTRVGLCLSLRSSPLSLPFGTSSAF